MKRQMRRSFKKIERKFNQAKDYATNLVRGTSSGYGGYSLRSSLPLPSTVSSTSSDTDDDLVFQPAADDSVPMDDDTGNAEVINIPCEFCHTAQPSENILHHQLRCRQNPNYLRRRTGTTNRSTRGSVRRAISESPAPIIPSAPPRSRSPSPTEGYPIPGDLLCPITHQIFVDPVVANDGHTYEREAIVQWLRTEKNSPVTREHVSVQKLNPNRIVKKMVDEFRAECKRKRLLYKYRLGIDLKKSEEVPYIQTKTKSIYKAEWLKNNSEATNSKIILIHLTGEDAEKIADINCRVEPHPNIAQVFGRVEHNDTGILLVQECPSTQTLSEFMKNTEQILSIAMLDQIFYQISSALQHLNKAEIIHGNISSDNIYIYHLDGKPENISVKLIIDKIESESLSTKPDVLAFGIVAIENYNSLEFKIDDKYSAQRQALTERCIAIDPNERPTFDELTDTLNDFIIGEK